MKAFFSLNFPRIGVTVMPGLGPWRWTRSARATAVFPASAWSRIRSWCAVRRAGVVVFVEPGRREDDRRVQ